MDLLPAIDLRQGRVVRLRQGDDGRSTTYSADPLAVAARFAAAGARRIHVVDLDAAFGEPPQRALVERLVAALAAGPAPGCTVQLGGGLRDGAAVQWALAAGCERAVLASLPARDPAAFAALARRFAGRIVPAVEVAGGELRAAGWTQRVAGTLDELCASLRGLPCPAILVTDVERDGMMSGPNLDLACRAAAVSGLPALVSGGVHSLADLQAAARHAEIGGVILGRALYEGTFDLAAALALVAGRPEPLAAAAGPAGASPGGPAALAAGLTGLTRRVIPCLDVAAGRVVKGVRFADLADQGDPAEAAARYAEQGADEIVFLDVTAAPEGRDTDLDWVRRTAERVFIPLTVGGGVRSVADASRLLHAGADKVAVNTAAVRRPELIGELARRFGSQCVVLSVDVRAVRGVAVAGAGAGADDEQGAAGAVRGHGRWEVVVEGGRTPTGLDAVAWMRAAVAAGAGEILLTSIDRDGTRDGYDLPLLAAAAAAVPVPLIASGGAGHPDHLAAALRHGAAAVLAASIFHQGDWTVGAVKRALSEAGFPMRPPAPPALPALPAIDGGGFLMIPPAAPDPATLRYDDRGLLPVVVQDVASGAVLMLAWADRHAVELTIETGEAHFWSRSRQALWRKGETSGNTLAVASITADCDGDALLVRARPAGPTCHRGTRSCFEPNPAALELGWLAAVIAERRAAADPAGSYTARLLAAGVERLAQKVGEEGVETAIAALAAAADPTRRAELVAEGSDLIFHLLVLLAASDVPAADLAAELSRRHALRTARTSPPPAGTHPAGADAAPPSAGTPPPSADVRGERS